MKRTIVSVISCMLVILLLIQPVFALSAAETSGARLVEETVNVLEDELKANGTNVSLELHNMIDMYRDKAATVATDEESEQINGLIRTLEDLLAEYQLYDSGISTYKFHPIYTPAVAAVIAYFNAKKYLLAAELLTHARENTDRVSIYTPAYGARARNSEVVRNLAYGTAVSGSASFEPGDNPVDIDLYYSIHDFDFFKSSATSKVVNIFDTYDFKHDADAYKTIPGTAVETMYKAQEAGYLTPYFVLFEVAV